jgi:hypothetical protein
MEQSVALVDLVPDAILLNDVSVNFNVANIAELRPLTKTVRLARGKPRGLVVQVAKLARKRDVTSIIELCCSKDEHAVFGHSLPDRLDGVQWNGAREVDSGALGPKGWRERSEADARIGLGRG